MIKKYTIDKELLVEMINSECLGKNLIIKPTLFNFDLLMMNKKQLKKFRKFIALYLDMDKQQKSVLKTAFKNLPANPGSSLLNETMHEYFINIKGFMTVELIQNWKQIHLINHGNS